MSREMQKALGADGEKLRALTGEDHGPRWPTTALDDIAAERQRQIEQEGWTVDHDDGHAKDALALAAACYASPRRLFVADERVGRGYEPFTLYQDAWPWADEWWKPKNRRRDLVKAAALIVAEIERLDRSLPQPSNG